MDNWTIQALKLVETSIAAILSYYLAILSFSGKIPQIDQSQVNNLQPRSLKVKPNDFLMIDI